MSSESSGRGSTPAREKATLSSANQYQFTEGKRDALIADAEGSSRILPFEDFFKLLPTVNDDGISRTLKALRSGRTPLVTRAGRWRGFSVVPSKSHYNENRVFSHLEPVINRIFELTRRFYPNKGLLLKYSSRPDTVPGSKSRTSRSRPDGYGEREAPNPEDSDSWEHIVFSAECKKNKAVKDRRDNIRKNMWSQYQAIRDNPRRRFALGFTIEDTEMRLSMVTRSALLTTPTFDFIKDHEHFVRFFMALQFANEERLGYDPTMTRVPGSSDQYDIVVQSSPDAIPTVYRTFQILSNHLADSLFGRGSRVYKVKELKNGEVTGEFMVLKDTWIDSHRVREGNQIASIREAVKSQDEATRAAFEKHFLHVVDHGDVLIPDEDGLLRVDDHTLILRNLEFPFDAPKFDLLREKPTDPKPSLPKGGERGWLPMQDSNQVIRGPMTHYRIVYKECGTVLYNLTSMTEVSKALEDVCIGLAALHQAGFIHRDIGISNIFVDEEGNTRVGDLEYSLRMNSEEPAHPVRTAMPDFIAAEVQQAKYAFFVPKVTAMKKAHREDATSTSENPDTVRSRPPVSQASAVSDLTHRLEKAVRFFQNPVHDLESVLWILFYVVWNRTPMMPDATKEIEDAFFEVRKTHTELVYGDRVVALRDGHLGGVPDGYYPPLYPGTRAIRKIWAEVHTLYCEIESSAEKIAAIDHTVAQDLSATMAVFFDQAKGRFAKDPVELISWDEEIQRDMARRQKAREVQEAAANEAEKMQQGDKDLDGAVGATTGLEKIDEVDEEEEADEVDEVAKAVETVEAVAVVAAVAAVVAVEAVEAVVTVAAVEAMDAIEATEAVEAAAPSKRYNLRSRAKVARGK